MRAALNRGPPKLPMTKTRTHTHRADLRPSGPSPGAARSAPRGGVSPQPSRQHGIGRHYIYIWYTYTYTWYTYTYTHTYTCTCICMCICICISCICVCISYVYVVPPNPMLARWLRADAAARRAPSCARRRSGGTQVCSVCVCARLCHREFWGPPI